MKIKVDANGIRSWETDPSVLGKEVAKVAQMALDYLNRRAKGITATKHASGFISLLNISKYDLERKIDKNVPQLAGKYFEWCVYVEFTKMLKKYDPDVKADGTKESFYNQRNYLMPYRAKYPTLMPQI